jgi:hypothetical protein
MVQRKRASVDSRASSVWRVRHLDLRLGESFPRFSSSAKVLLCSVGYGTPLDHRGSDTLSGGLNRE